MIAICQVLFAVALPGIAMYTTQRLRVQGWLSPVVICYGLGIVAGNIPSLELNTTVADYMTKLTVPLAIPMLLIITDLKRWLNYAGSALLSFFLALVAVTVTTFLVAWLFLGDTDQGWIYSGMLAGVYTGGTPNMSAVGLALEADEETFVLLNAADIAVSATYLLFLTSIGQKVMLLFCPPFQPTDGQQAENEPVYGADRPGPVHQYLITLGISAVICGLSGGITYLVHGDMQIAFLIMLLTTFSIIGSFFPRLRRLRGAYDFGQYLLLIFAVAMGMLSDFTKLMDASSTIFLYTFAVVGGSILIHYVLAALFRIDADTVLITSTASLFGPIFIGHVATALRNKDVIFSGMAMGLLGYAFGNYLGIGIAYWIKSWLF